MIGLGVSTLVAGALQLSIPSYALRLVRRFGTKRVGWFIVTAFLTLAVLHLVGALRPMSIGPVTGITLDLVLVFSSVLLLVGMGHIETLFAVREQNQTLEEQLRCQWELRVKEETADLARANQELIQEIARRKEIQKNIEDSLAQYRSLFVENPQAMWILDLRTCRFLTVNDAALRQYGFRREEFMALTGRDLLLPEDATPFLQDVARPSPGIESRGLWQHCRKDGVMMNVEITTLDVQFAGLSARLVLATDITQRRVREAETIKKRKMEAFGQVAGGVAHHISNLLNIIEGHVFVLLQKTQDLKSTEELAHISSAVTRAAALSRQLLAAGGRQAVNMEHLDVNALIRRLSPMLCRLVSESIALEHSYSPHVRPIVGDRHLVEHVIVNLVLNARNAMPEGGTLGISTDLVRADGMLTPEDGQVRSGDYVRLEISDTGCGMTPEVQARVFEPFFTTREPGHAAGMGLASSYGIVKQLSGWMEFTSEPGAGTEFRIFLPCAPKPSEDEASALPSQFKATILLVEPHDRARALARFVLENHQYRVIEADCATTALMLLAGKTADVGLLLCDTELPGEISGCELAARIRQGRPELKVIYASSRSPDAIRKQLPPGEEFDLIAKPFNPEKILTAVEATLDRAS